MKLSSSRLTVPAVSGAELDARLEVQALVLEDGSGSRLVLVGADIIWFSDEMAAQLRRSIASLAKVAPEAVILSATHTHGSPQPDRRFPFGRQDPGWVARFEQIVLVAVSNAVMREPTRVRFSAATSAIASPISVHRRRVAWHFTGGRPGRRAQTLPNPSRPIDSSIRVLVARDGEQHVRAVVVHMPCHPVSLPRDVPGADFPGVLRERLLAQYGPETVVLFLQGHCGDIRPRLVHKPRGLKDHLVERLIGPRFRPSRDGDAQTIGSVLAVAAERAITDARPLTGVRFAAVRDRLPLSDVSGSATGRDLDVTLWRLADDLTIIASSGEMLSGLAAADRTVWSAGYCNGMAGYIAPASEYADGGYEIDGFLEAFGLERRFAIETGSNYEALRATLVARLDTRRPAVAAA